MMDAAPAFDETVIRCLHEVARAAREVPPSAQPRRLQDALVALVALEVFSTGTVVIPRSSDDGAYSPGAAASS